MASNRSKTRTHDAVQAASTDTPTQALTALTRRAVRIQIAACSAAAKTFSRWVQAGDDLAQVVGDELLRRVDGQSDSAELVTRVTQATGSHLRELSALPRTATDHFDARLARGPIDYSEGPTSRPSELFSSCLTGHISTTPSRPKRRNQ